MFSDRAPEGWVFSPGDADTARVDALLLVALDEIRRRRATAMGRSDWAELEVLSAVLGTAMDADEYANAMRRRGPYVACRRVETVDVDALRRAGL